MEFINEPVFDKDRYLAACGENGEKEGCETVKNCDYCHNPQCNTLCRDKKFPWQCANGENN
ncbi:hypothetical protein PW5551_04015 [Petrotoga sp. 9PW.55.5.1]|uniref:hypothetical protein n=1 Tax=unclassified Petrotoga TaxID=2620614 RepID=UPI000CBF0A1D|nr:MULTISPECIES: hypothetical protein [unclassified Petrotoga]PNR89050.1 hypothetical protein X925_04085 [Petrotoga sp. 9T1HF07.CasAA.8.2]RAO99413.1 hypothetical protein PW5551_04015 [Petrotoga sp. 9PW.55.5.1]